MAASDASSLWVENGWK